MTKKLLVLLSLILVAMLALAACTTNDMEEMDEMEESEVMMDDDSEMEEMDAEDTDMEESMDDDMDDDMAMEEVDVEALIIERVEGKHDVERIFNAVKTREEWEETLDRMIEYGAKITPEEKEMMIVWLLENQDEAMMEDDMAMEEVDVEALIIERLEGKHDAERIFNADKTREEWEETLDRMIGYGAKITPEEKELMIDWLLSR